MTAAAPSRKEAMKAAVDAVINVAEDIVAGRISLDELEAVAAERACLRCRTVSGPGDSHWPMQVDICRAVLAAGGIPPNELAEWTAVGRSREMQGN